MPQQPDLAASPRPYWPELDILRGIAASLMICNHVGVVSVAPQQSRLVDAFVFVGSFAPVLFFFVTGLGAGIQSSRTNSWSHHLSLLEKVVILLAADAMFWLPRGRMIGNDFFGFIGLSMLLLSFFRPMRHGSLWASILAVGLLILRFGLGPYLREITGPDLSGKVIGILVGTDRLPGFSYPHCPWLIYPLIGFTIGQQASHHRNTLESVRYRLAGSWASSAIVFSVMAWVLAPRGLFRYGMMSLAYFIASLGFLNTLLALVLVIGRKPSLAWPWKLMTLSGVQSFAVVPIHYALIPVCATVLGSPIDAKTYFRNATIIYVLSVAGSMLIPWIAGRISERYRQVAQWSIVTATAFVLAGLIRGAFHSPVTLAVITVTQLGLCLLFALQSTRPRSRTSATLLKDNIPSGSTTS